MSHHLIAQSSGDLSASDLDLTSDVRDVRLDQLPLRVTLSRARANPSDEALQLGLSLVPQQLALQLPHHRQTRKLSRASQSVASL